MKITCSQFENLLSFYINEDLSNTLKLAVEQHMQECSYCKEKYTVICTIVNNIKDAYNKYICQEGNGVDKGAIKDETIGNAAGSTVNKSDIIIKNENSDMYDDYNCLELSAYIDNELPDERSIKIRQNISSRPKIRKKIERLYNLSKLLRNCQMETKNSLKADYSKNIVTFLNENYAQRKTYMHCLYFIMLVTASVIVSIWAIVHLI